MLGLQHHFLEDIIPPTTEGKEEKMQNVCLLSQRLHCGGGDDGDIRAVEVPLVGRLALLSIGRVLLLFLDSTLPTWGLVSDCLVWSMLLAVVMQPREKELCYRGEGFPTSQWRVGKEHRTGQIYTFAVRPWAS